MTVSMSKDLSSSLGIALDDLTLQQGHPVGVRVVQERSVAVVPVLNEVQNIRCLVESVLATGRVGHIFVVDDGSTDGTLETLEEVAREEPRLDFEVRRNERGFGTAVLFGFRECLRRYDFDRLVQMDGDLSHDPAAIPGMLDMPADLVIGSRYTRGGQVVNWPLPRRVISIMANGLARRFLGLPVRDVTSGFRVYSRRLVQTIVDEANCGGYEMLVEAVWLADHYGLTLQETPIRFLERRNGRSKLATQEEAAKFVRFVLRKSFEKLT
jgi:dolichol-phosphate mannosyltransferase